MGSSLATQLPHLGIVALSDDELAAVGQPVHRSGRRRGPGRRPQRPRRPRVGHALWGDTLALQDELAEIAASARGDLASLSRSADGRPRALCVWGPDPGRAYALARIDRHACATRCCRPASSRSTSEGTRAAVLAMLDRPDDARQDLGSASALARRAAHLPLLTRSMGAGYTYWLLRDLDRAAELFQHGADMLESQGEVGWLSTLLPMLGEVRLRQGDVEEARRCAERSRDICPPRDIESNARWRALLARVESLAGGTTRHYGLAAEAIEWERRGDQLDAHR